LARASLLQTRGVARRAPEGRDMIVCRRKPTRTDGGYFNYFREWLSNKSNFVLKIAKSDKFENI
jgi:hypothetical protein